jgi:hypothetical protein
MATLDRHPDRDTIQRLKGGLIAIESAEHVLTEALRAMVETRFLLVCGHPEDAVAALERGIAAARYALNQTDEEPDPTDPLEKL